jgi:hypothetical protein
MKTTARSQTGDRDCKNAKSMRKDLIIYIDYNMSAEQLFE